jgi:hypothetical protein
VWPLPLPSRSGPRWLVAHGTHDLGAALHTALLELSLEVQQFLFALHAPLRHHLVQFGHDGWNTRRGELPDALCGLRRELVWEKGGGETPAVTVEQKRGT